LDSEKITCGANCKNKRARRLKKELEFWKKDCAIDFGYGDIAKVKFFNGEIYAYLCPSYNYRGGYMLMKCRSSTEDKGRLFSHEILFSIKKQKSTFLKMAKIAVARLMSNGFKLID
jgi:hypothetical protein